MTQFLGAFRDDYYNAINVLPQSQSTGLTGALSGTVLTAAQMSGAGDTYLVLSGQTAAQTATTDTAANLILNLQTAVANVWKTTSTFAGSQVVPPSGVPNLFNLTWTLTLNNQNTSSGALTLTAGTGVTLAAVGGLSSTVIAVTTVSVWVCSVTGTSGVTLTRVQ
jgi:hypothetical protein